MSFEILSAENMFTRRILPYFLSVALALITAGLRNGIGSMAIRIYFPFLHLNICSLGNYPVSSVALFDKRLPLHWILHTPSPFCGTFSSQSLPCWILSSSPLSGVPSCCAVGCCLLRFKRFCPTKDSFLTLLSLFPWV